MDITCGASILRSCALHQTLITSSCVIALAGVVICPHGNVLAMTQGEAGSGSNLRSGSRSTSWISAEGRSLSSSGSDSGLLPDIVKAGRSQTVSTPASAPKTSGLGCLPKPLSEKIEEAELQGAAEADPELDEEDEALRAAAALDAMRAPGRHHCKHAAHCPCMLMLCCKPLARH